MPSGASRSSCTSNSSPEVVLFISLYLDLVSVPLSRYRQEQEKGGVHDHWRPQDHHPGRERRAFACDDIQTTHRELTSRGVTFPVPPMKMPFGWWALFEDNDGTRYALTQANA